MCGPDTPIWRTGQRNNGRFKEGGRWRCSVRIKAQPSRGRYLDPRRELEARWRSRGIVGMTFARFEAMVIEQAGRCALCNVELLFPQLDHDHSTGEPRGILCTTCNTGLGKFEDDPERLEAAARYLRRST